MIEVYKDLQSKMGKAHTQKVVATNSNMRKNLGNHICYRVTIATKIIVMIFVTTAAAQIVEMKEIQNSLKFIPSTWA